MRRIADIATSILTATLVVGAVYLAIRPGGVVRAEINRIQDAWIERAALSREWEQIRDGSMRFDDSGEQVRLVVFSDYECPYCRDFHHALNEFLRSYGDVGVAYRNLPLRIHANADAAARAVVCADEQGRFRALHTWFFETSDWRTIPEWSREADAAQLPDIAAFVSCIGSERARARVAADLALAQRLKIRGTPALVTKNKIVRGTLSADALRVLLDST